ncbi:hypothetical protein E1176_06915 [Fulvivirga sp. RKSG066]|nr:hypothetical protein [Fulvivirga aurantia]
MSCTSDDPGTDPITDLTFEAVLSQGEIEDVPETTTRNETSASEIGKEDRTETTEGGEEIETRWVCSEKTMSVTGGNSNFPLFNPNVEVIYPGNLLQGKSLNDATPSPIVVKRGGGTISYDLNTGSNPSFSVDEVSRSSIGTAMNEIIANASDVVPANFQLDIINVQSETQLALEMGLTLKTWTTKAKANMSFSQDKSYNRFLVKLKQSYYTMIYDFPTNVEELFDPSVTPEDLSPYVASDNPATFISSVTYGRIFYLLVESTSTREEMDAKLNVSYSKFGNSASGSVDVETFKSLKNLKIKVIAYGGDAKGSFELAAEPSVEQLAERLANSTDIRTGVPLSYTVRSAKRPDQIVSTNLATEYNIVQCDLRGTLPPQSYKALIDVFADDDEPGIGAASNIACSNAVMFNHEGDKYVWFKGTQGEILGEYSIKDPNAPLGEIIFDGIGAAARVQNTKIYLFDKSGINFIVLNTGWLPSCDVDLSQPLGPYDEKDGAVRIYNTNEYWDTSPNYPFSGEGLEAACRHFDPNRTITHYFVKPGSRYAHCELKNKKFTWKDDLSISKWAGVGIGFDQVGAACRIDFQGDGGGGTEVKRQLFFDKAGTSFTIWNPNETYDSLKFSPPYIIN